MMENQSPHSSSKGLIKSKKDNFNYAEKTIYTLFDISNAVNTTHDLEELYHFIYKALDKLLSLPNFFIALYDKKNNTLNFEYFVDEFDQGFPVMEDKNSPHSLTGEVIQNGRALFLKENMLIERKKNHRLGGTIPKIWLGTPIFIQSKAIGAVCIQHYTLPDYFSHKHLELIGCVAAQIAVAIERKQILKTLEREKKTLRLITENTQSIIFIVDSNWIYEFANPAHEQLNCDPVDLHGTSFFERIYPEDAPLILEFLEKGIQGHIFRSPMTFRMKDTSGNFHQLSGTFEIIRHNDGIIDKMIFIGQKESKGSKTQTTLKKENSLNSIGKNTAVKIRTILIIEDEEQVRAIAAKALKSFGYNILEAEDGETGVYIYQKSHQKIDAVLLDVILPGISGAQTFEQMLHINPNAQIIITSGHITNQDQEHLFSKAAGYLEKPYQIAVLKQALKTVLS